MADISLHARIAKLRSHPTRHLTPRYIRDRLHLMAYEHAHPEAPWLTQDATRLLESLLRPADRGAEFGSGRSTLWFARRVAALTSVEHDPSWYDKVATRLKAQGLTNVDYILASDGKPQEKGDDSSYTAVALSFPDASLDFSLVDGRHRDYTAKFILPKITPGGILVIDNANRYLPCQTTSPSSRSPELGPLTAVWAEVAAEISSWRRIWTTNGVSDTVIFIKPGDSSAQTLQAPAERPGNSIKEGRFNP